MVNNISHRRPSLPPVDGATARHASDAPSRPSPSINFVTTTSRTDSITSRSSSHASSSRSDSLSQLDRGEGAATHHPTSAVRTRPHRTGSAPPNRMRKSALARIMNMEGLESQIHVDPMRSDSLRHFDSATSGASGSWQGGDSELTDGRRTRSALIDTVHPQPLPDASRSPHSKFKALLGRGAHLSLEPRQQHDPPSRSPRGGDEPRRPEMSRTVSEPGPKGRHGRAKSVSALFGLASSQEDEIPPLPNGSHRPDAQSESVPEPSTPVKTPAARPPSSWIRQRLRPSSSSISLGTSRKSPGLSNSVNPNRTVGLSSTPSSTSVHTIQSSAHSQSSTAQSWQSKSDFGFIKALGSFVAGRLQTKVDDPISDEELLRWRKPALERDRAPGELGANERFLTNSELSSSGREYRESSRASSSSNVPSRETTEEEILVIGKSGRSGVKSTSMVSRTTRQELSAMPSSIMGVCHFQESKTRTCWADSAVPLKSSHSNNHMQQSTCRSRFGDEQMGMRAGSKTSHPATSSPYLIENRPLRSPRSSPCLPRSKSTGMEAASQLAASLSLHTPSKSRPPPLPLGLAPRPAAAPRRKPPTGRMSTPTVGEARRIISNEAWEQVSLSARKTYSTRSVSASSAASPPLTPSSSSRTSANENLAVGVQHASYVTT
ncbi:BZ3500_MvSof-1268-A1-R1_Chr5-2g07735 [Microbotryum saponariae]|uniref:BZ3500_MvSof-1268-A1-R1_Chr5-2g07735 protein n=1 Tax=Microbotryum saponariae TaxID=289078 RepID=A0A2X0LF22_9BASI|nr:BZ3500_MvSof-1268-A1-R1_Chr5-2g07735 [Microbotryum saponariae]SDA05604.1 BZ3501_MvSof-1269-A2-R1_Chr5-2g07557 [Microbotryum saponariae]